MKLDDLVKRADELIEMANKVLATKERKDYGWEVNYSLFHAFRSAGLSFLERVFGAKHAYYKEFDAVLSSTYIVSTEAGKQILEAAKDEISGQWLFTVKGLVSAEIFADFIVLAKQSLDENEGVSAVLVSAALEDALKRVAAQQNLDVEDKDMSEVINALKANGALKGPQATIAKGYVKLRNKAFHAEWDKIDKGSVSSAIGFTEQFLLKHFG